MEKTIIEKIKKAPSKAGIYFFKNKKGEVIYVGRAVNLRNRLKNYLHPADFKIKKMTEEAGGVEFKTTKNLLEAIVLEANFIKKHEPIYNTREKDNRSFVYLVIPKTEWTYPRIVRQREVEKYLLSNAFVFGPLQSYSLAKTFLNLLRKIFPFSTCQLNQGKPCFHYQIGLCLGKCLGKISEKDYQRLIEQLIAFLKGKVKKVREFLIRNFPEKAFLLENIEDISLVNEEIASSLNQKIEAYDISHFFGRETVGSLVVFKNNDFDKSLYRFFKIKKAKPHDDLSALREVLERRLVHQEWNYPDLILVDGGRGQVKTLEEVLEERRLKIPVVGIAKFQRDKLIFGKNVKKSVKELLSISFKTLQKIRDEAHRLANYYRQKRLRLAQKKTLNKN
jgi:excinuclease ABC subunit C